MSEGKWPRISELPEAEREAFCAWLDGQTVPWVEGEGIQDFYYPWDYKTWKERASNGKPYIWD